MQIRVDLKLAEVAFARFLRDLPRQCAETTADLEDRVVGLKSLLATFGEQKLTKGYDL